MPYSSLDLNNNGTFKIEYSDDIDKLNKDMRDFYPDGYFITNCMLGEEININVIPLIKTLIHKKYHNDKEDIWIQCTQAYMNSVFGLLRDQMGHTDYKEYGLTGRNDKDYKLYKVDQREDPIFGGLVVYHT